MDGGGAVVPIMMVTNSLSSTAASNSLGSTSSASAVASAEVGKSAGDCDACGYAASSASHSGAACEPSLTAVKNSLEGVGATVSSVSHALRMHDNATGRCCTGSPERPAQSQPTTSDASDRAPSRRLGCRLITDYEILGALGHGQYGCVPRPLSSKRRVFARDTRSSHVAHVRRTCPALPLLPLTMRCSLFPSER